jgi:hypothetical protein
VTQLAADRNLLFGILALQMDFIRRGQLIGGMNAWVLDKAKPLGHVLVEQGVLSAERRTLLDALVQKHLKQHGDDPQRSLAAVVPDGVGQDLRQVTDAYVQASLARTPTAPAGPAADATGAYVPASTLPPAARFQILRPHARGALGEVFVARDQELHREVALKEIQECHAHNPESRDRFFLEAEVTGGLEHLGIVPVYGLGTYRDGRPFFAMRFIKVAKHRYRHPPTAPVRRAGGAADRPGLTARCRAVPGRAGPCQARTELPAKTRGLWGGRPFLVRPPVAGLFPGHLPRSASEVSRPCRVLPG